VPTTSGRNELASVSGWLPSPAAVSGSWLGDRSGWHGDEAAAVLREAASARNCRVSSWTSGERKLPWIVDTPRGGCAGIRSMPSTRPVGLVRSWATYMKGMSIPQGGEGCQSMTPAGRYGPATRSQGHIPMAAVSGLTCGCCAVVGKQARTKSTTTCPALKILYLASIWYSALVEGLLSSTAAAHLEQLEGSAALEAHDFCVARKRVTALSGFPS